MIRFIRSVALFSLLGVAHANAIGGPVRKAPDTARDQTQTMQARRLLLQDPELAPFNIGVIVQDRVAILWGPVPSAEVAFRAELCLRTMVELSGVRNELMVNELLEPLRIRKNAEPPAPRLPELLPPELPKDVRLKLAPPGVLTTQEGGTNRLPAAQTMGHQKEHSAGAKPGETPPGARAKVSSNVSATEEDVTSAVRALLLRAPNFSSLQFAVRDGQVYLRSTQADQSDALQEAARIIARMPGVAGVILLNPADKNPCN